MLCLLLYDIPDNKVRTKVADICLDYGLVRIQYSAFRGEMNHNRQEQVLQQIRRKVGKRTFNCIRSAKRTWRSNASCASATMRWEE